MAIVERVKALNLPEGQYIVMGSGVMDAMGLREARDIDLVVAPEFFAELKKRPGWKVSLKHDEEVLEKDDQEVWLSWGSNGRPNFKEFYDESIVIDGVRFAKPEFMMRWKLAHPSAKNTEDATLLRAHLDRLT